MIFNDRSSDRPSVSAPTPNRRRGIAPATTTRKRESGMKTSAKMPTSITYVAARRGKKVVCETTAACSQSVAVAFQMAQSVGGGIGDVGLEKEEGGGEKKSGRKEGDRR